MNRKTTLTEDATATAEAQATADAELLASLQDREASVPEPEQQDPDPETTIADKMVGLAHLAVRIRKDLRLSEALIGKLAETALQWHAWDYQRRLQENSNPFANMVANGMGSEGAGEADGLVGPDPDEFLGAADTPETPDNVIVADFRSAPVQE